MYNVRRSIEAQRRVKEKAKKETDKEEDKKSDANAVREATKVKKWLNVRLFKES